MKQKNEQIANLNLTIEELYKKQPSVELKNKELQEKLVKG